MTLFSCYFLIWEEPTSKQIFDNSQKSVVELKSQTGDDIISYDTAVFVKSEGILVSNAHMITDRQSGVYKVFESFQIRFSFEKNFRKVSLIKYDMDLDLSILQLDN